MKITCFPKYYKNSASSRYRTYQYVDSFNEKHDIEVYPFFDEKYSPGNGSKKIKDLIYLFRRYIKRLFVLISKHRQTDLFFVEKEFFLLFHLKDFFTNTFRIKYILDYDDAIFHKYDNSKNKAIKFLLENKIKNLVSSARAVCTGSSYLTRYALNYNENVFEIPTSIDLENYDTSKVKSQKNKFIVGWIGSKTTSKNLFELKESINKITNIDSEIVFHFIGFDNLSKHYFEGFPIVFIDWEDKKECEQIAKFDIGIMPLEDKLFNHGKCAFKLIQYMACAKPTISTPFESNLNVDKGNGNLFASSEEDWVESILKIKSNYDFYQKIGLKNRQTVVEHYSTQANAKKYLEVFDLSF